MLKKLYLLSIAFVFSFSCAFAGAWYVVDANPWGQNTNITAMDNVFGAGNWSQGTFSTPAATIFTAGTSFVMLEGSDGNVGLPAFFTTNQAIIENWVNTGGRLFINAAPNYGSNQDWGFGGTTLMYPNFAAAVSTTVPSDPIFAGPYVPTSTAYTGNSFAHGYITGTGLTSLLYDTSATPDSLSVLAYKNWGSGIVFFGGCTQPNYWAPSAQGLNLWYNIIASAAAFSPGPCGTPVNLAVSNITTDGATFNWIDSATSYVVVIDSSAATPLTAGDTIFTDSFTATGLQHDSTYYFHVRALCDSTNTWVTISFTTAHLSDCASPAGYATVSFTQVSPYAILHWSTPGATQYFWVLDTTATDPAVMGNATTDTVKSFASLVSNLTYYFHVRSICANGDTSAWTTISFVTASCPYPTVTATVNETPVGPYASIHWTAPTAAEYFWVLDRNPADPTGMGNMTTNTSMSFANLWTGTDYYFHIRCICINGDTSTWVTIMFHTPGQHPTNVSNVNSDGTTVICSPNPTSDKITITITGAVYDNATLTLSGLDGRLIANMPVTDNSAVIDMSNLPATLYFVKYTNKDYNSIIKVMKQ